MAKILITTLLIIVLALAACSGSTPTQKTVVAPIPMTVAATAPPPANTPEPTAPTRTTSPTPNEEPAEIITPPPAQDLNPVLSSLSDAELACIGEDPERMLAALTGGGAASMEEQAQLIGCLDDDTVDLIFMSTIIPVPLSVETSDCILAALDVIDPRTVMNARMEEDPQTAVAGIMAAFTVSVACLNDKEWTTAAPRMGMEPEDRQEMVSVMAALGGPAEMATAMTETMEAEDAAEGTALHQASLECQKELKREPEPATAPEPETADPTPAPRATPWGATPTSTIPTITPTTAPPRTTAPTPAQQSPGLWRGVVIAPENRCSPYDSDDYPYSQSVEAKVVNAQGGIYGPYTGTWFNSTGETDIEHVLARSEAHDSGLCAASRSTRSLFASDLLNLTLASPSVNRHQKSGKDLTEWLPALNQCWYVDRTIQVRLKYGLTIDRAEAEAADRVLAGCQSTAMIVLAPGTPTGTAPAGNDAPASSGEGNALELYDDNGNGRITCAEARAHGIAPVHRSHPAYEFMRDADGDGVVCE